MGSCKAPHHTEPRSFPEESNLGWDVGHIGRRDYVHSE